MVSVPGRGWPRAYCRGVAGLGGAGARPPAGLIWSPAVLGLAVGLGDPWSYCRGVAARWLDAEFCRPRAYGGGGIRWGLGFLWGCCRGWLWVILCVSGVRVVGVGRAIKAL